MSDDQVARAVDSLYAPINDRLKQLQQTEFADLWAVEPAFRFDPVESAGGLAPQTRWDSPASTPARDIDVRPGIAVADMSVAELVTCIRNGVVSTQQVVAGCLNALRDVGKNLNAVIRLVDPPPDPTSMGPLGGVPYGVKDVIETAGVPTTAGSRQLASHVPNRDADVVARLNAAGAVLIAKLHTTEFAASGTGLNDYFGPARNPWNLERLTLGSSSGSAAAVAARALPFAIGTDLGGSVRIPAAACGVVGLRPTYGLVSRAGLIPLSWTHDQAGPICRTVRDAALLLREMTGGSQGDYEAAAATSSDIRALRIGVPRRWLDDTVEEAVNNRFASALETLADLGATIVDLEVPPAMDLALINRIIAYAEASAWHLRFLTDSPELYGRDVLPRQLAGLRIRAVDYLNAQRMRAQYCSRFHVLWQQTDVIVTPTIPLVAPPQDAPSSIFANLMQFATPISLLGYPAISIPAGFSEEGLPVGLQIVAPPRSEIRLLRVAATFEAATKYGEAAPSRTEAPRRT